MDYLEMEGSRYINDAQLNTKYKSQHYSVYNESKDDI